MWLDKPRIGILAESFNRLLQVEIFTKQVPSGNLAMDFSHHVRSPFSLMFYMPTKPPFSSGISQPAMFDYRRVLYFFSGSPGFANQILIN